ncbi:MAG TPA: hypothetical protein VLH75_13620 [Longimicrobiales bacterium]|nr:hypothetical protein [Longimicrobiales bacterium]
MQRLLSALVVFRLQPYGFTNRDLREHLAPLLGLEPGDITPGRMTHDLRRLRLHGLIERIAGTHRCGLASIHDDEAAPSSRLRASFRHVEHAMDDFRQLHGLAA